MTSYNIRHNFSAPLRVTELTSDVSRLQRSVAALARAAVDALSEIFDAYTVSEWIEQRIYPGMLALEKVQTDSRALMSRKIWDKRPLPQLEDLKKFGIGIPDPENH
jgi:hexosaminidase